MTENQTTPSAPLRILVVENDPKWRDDHLTNLIGWGYKAYAAEPAKGDTDSFQSLWEDAKAKATRNRCHVALVDMRLRDDDDPGDTSGLKLVPWLAPTVSIIVSSHGDAKTVRAALKPPPDVPKRAHDFVGKEDGPEALLNTIIEAVKFYWPRFVRKAIDWTSFNVPNSSHLIQRFFPNDGEVPQEEIEDLLWKLFPKARDLRVSGLENADRTPSTSVRPRSVLLQVWEDDKVNPDIVKIARSDRPPDEYNRYLIHVDGKFPRNYYATLKRVESLWDVRGARYEHVGNWGRMALFRKYYRSRNPQDIRRVIQTFANDWGDHYFRTRSDSDRSLFQEFTAVWGENWVKRLSQSDESLSLTSSEGLRDWFEKTLGLDDPIIWLRKRLGMDGVNVEDWSPSPVRMAVLHGDLQGDNCFVDTENSHLWLIDFERSGPGPIVEDWVEMEVDILTRLSCFSLQDRHDFLELIARLNSPLDFWQPAPLVTGLPEAVKAFEVIAEIRRQAKTTTRLSESSEDTRLYRWALLLNVAFRFTLPISASYENPYCNLSIADRSLLLGGVICRSLLAEDDTWPPREWGIPVARTLQANNLGLDLQVTIQNDSDLVYRLHGGRYVNHNAGTIKLRRAPENILQGVFDELSALARKSSVSLTEEQHILWQDRLADIGHNLFEELFPTELRQEYVEFIRRSPRRSLRIVSDDPWIPWEIVKPQLRDGVDPHLCEFFYLSRWLSGEAPPNQFDLSKVVVVLPPSNLVAAERERSYVSNLPSATPSHVRSVRLITSVNEVLDSFRNGDASLYHFICHGNFDTSDPNESRLTLKDGSLRASQITGEKRTGLRKAKPVVFLNACHTGQLGFGLTRLGGWAKRFLEAGASAFIGTLWEVNDQLASDFAIEFYNRLLGEQGHPAMPLAQAINEARMVIKEKAPANPTWLAYVLYGNPNARVV